MEPNRYLAIFFLFKPWHHITNFMITRTEVARFCFPADSWGWGSSSWMRPSGHQDSHHNLSQPRLETIQHTNIWWFWMHVVQNLSKQQLRTNCDRWGYQIGINDYCWQWQVYVGGVGATTSWEHGQAHNCEAPACLRRQNYCVPCLRLLSYLCSYYSGVWFVVRGSVLCSSVCPNAQGPWTTGNSASIFRMTTLMAMTSVVLLSKVSWSWTPFRFAIIVTACFPALLLRQPTNQNLRPGCNSCQPEIIEMAEEPHPAWDLGACAKGQT